MLKYIGDSKVPVMEFCEYCWEVLNDEGTCPTEGCVHNDLLNSGKDDADDTSPT